MNNRIKELALQAREYATTRHPMSNIILSVNSDLFEEKFAELIVAEVLAVQEKFIADGHNAWHLNKPTRKHFGVEE